MAGDGWRKRLQLALWPLVALGEEFPPAGDQRRFAAVTREGEEAAVVTFHRAPPAGPEPAMMHAALGQLAALAHPVLSLPIADGEVDGRWWVVELNSPGASAGQRLRQGRLPLGEAVAAIRDLARAVVVMHRRGITHGAISLDSVRLTPTGASLGGFGVPSAGSARLDLDALARVAWALLSGETGEPTARPLSAMRRGVSRALDAFTEQLHDAIAAGRPWRAEAILESLDAIPVRRPARFDALAAVDSRLARPSPLVAWAIVAAAVLLVIALVATRG